MEKNKTVTWVIVIAVVVGGLSFYGGMTYAHSKTGSAFQGARGTFGGGSGRAGGPGRFNGGGAPTAGQIIAKDSKSITVQLSSGGSKIVFYSPTTQIMHTTTGTPTDLTNGEDVVVMGTTNSDGSVTANDIQIRPALPTRQQTTTTN